MTVLLRAALYLRVSTARQAEHDVSIPDPSFSSLPRMRGVPHSGFSMLICPMSTRSSV